MHLRRCSFLLMEVFIAIVLLSLCLLPMMTFPYKAAQKEREALFALEVERLSTVAFAHFVQEKNSLVSLADLLENGEEEVELPEVTLACKKYSHTYRPKIKITVEEKLEKEKKAAKLLLKCTVNIHNKNSLYYLVWDLSPVASIN